MPCMQMNQVIDRRKRSKALSKVKPVENISKNLHILNLFHSVPVQLRTVMIIWSFQSVYGSLRCIGVV